jgi:hypothetical protein
MQIGKGDTFGRYEHCDEMRRSQASGGDVPAIAGADDVFGGWSCDKVQFGAGVLDVVSKRRRRGGQSIECQVVRRRRCSRQKSQAL